MHCHLSLIALVTLALVNAIPVEADDTKETLLERRGLQFAANNLFPSSRFVGPGFSHTNVFPGLAFSAGSGQIFSGGGPFGLGSFGGIVSCSGAAPSMPCPAPAPAPVPEPQPQPQPQPAPEPQPAPAPAPQPCDQGQAQGQGCPVPAPQPVPEPQPAPQPAPQPCDQSQGQGCSYASTAPATFNFSNSQNSNLQNIRYRENTLLANNEEASAKNIQAGTNTNLNYMGPG